MSKYGEYLFDLKPRASFLPKSNFPRNSKAFHLVCLVDCKPSVDDLSRFESDVLTMAHNVEFGPVRNNLLSKLRSEAKVISNAENLLVDADKSTNIYKIKKETS